MGRVFPGALFEGDILHWVWLSLFFFFLADAGANDRCFPADSYEENGK